MSRSWGRGQVEPLAALVAVAAVGLGLSLYVAAVSETLEPTSRPVAEPVMESVYDDLSPNGVLRPAALGTVVQRRGVAVNATVTTRDRRFTAGPTPPSAGREASRLVSVVLGPGRVRPGRLRVVVW